MKVASVDCYDDSCISCKILYLILIILTERKFQANITVLKPII